MAKHYPPKRTHWIPQLILMVVIALVVWSCQSQKFGKSARGRIDNIKDLIARQEINKAKNQLRSFRKEILKLQNQGKSAQVNPATNTALSIQDAAIYGRETRYTLMLTELGNLYKTITNSKTLPAEERNRLFADLAEVYARHGYAYNARQCLQQTSPISRDTLYNVFRLNLLAQTALIEGQNQEAFKLTSQVTSLFDTLTTRKNAKLSTALRYQEAASRVLRFKTIAAMGDPKALEPAAELLKIYFKKRFKDKTRYQFDYLVMLAKAEDQKGDVKKARRYYEKAIELLSKGECYNAHSLEGLFAREELIALLYEKGIDHKGANKVESLIRDVEKHHATIAEYEALKSLAILREYAALGKSFEAFDEMEFLLGWENKSYQFSPDFLRHLLKISYRINLQLDSSGRAEKTLDKIVRINNQVLGPKAPLARQSVLERNFHKSIFNGKWKVARDTFDLYWKADIEPQTHAAQAEHVYFLNMYARVLEETDQLRLAHRLLLESQRAVKQTWGEDHLLHASQLEKLAKADVALGAYVQAEDRLFKALEIVSRRDNQFSPIYVAVLRTAIDLYIQYGEYALAEDYITDAMRAEQRIFLTPNLMAEQSDDLEPVLAFLRGQYRLAEDGFLYQLKMAEFKGEASKASAIRPNTWLALTYLEMGDYGYAEQHAREAMEFSREVFGDSSRHYYQSRAVVQKLYRLIGDLERSKSLAEGNLVHLRRVYGPNHIIVGQAASELGLTKYLLTDSTQQAKPYFAETRRIYINNFGEEHPLYADALKDQAALLIDEGKLDSAANCLHQAAKIYRKKIGRKPVQLIEVLKLLGDLSLRRKETDKAQDYYNDALKLAAKEFRPESPKILNLKGRKGRCLIAANKPDQAFDLFKEITADYLRFFQAYFPFLSEREKAIFWQHSQPEFNLYTSLAIELYPKDKTVAAALYNQVLATKGLLLNNSQRLRNQLLNNADTKLAQQFRQWQTNKEILAGMLARTNLSADEAQRLNILTDETGLLEKKLNDQSGAFNQITSKVKPATYEQIWKSLKPNEYAIEIVRARYFNAKFTDTVNYVALIVGGKYTQPIMVDLTSGNELESRSIKYYRNAVKYGIPDSLSYQNFWQPLAGYFTNQSTVYVGGEGVYNQLNLAGLYKGNGQFLADSLTIVAVGNTKDLIRNTTRVKRPEPIVTAGDRTALLIGNPDYYANTDQRKQMAGLGLELKPLKGTEQEVAQISQTLQNAKWRTESLLHAAATEDAIKTKPAPKVLHIATHGAFVNDDEDLNQQGLKAEAKTAENSLVKVGVVMAGGGTLLMEDSIKNLNQRPGILTAYEAMNLNLNATDLVVLSACETGQGHLQNGEGVYGLQRAFLVAGAKNVIFSFFKVDDAITAELMAAFYTNFANGKSTARKSFAEAQKAIRLKYPDKPHYWASFSMLGL